MHSSLFQKVGTLSASYQEANNFSLVATAAQAE